MMHWRSMRGWALFLGGAVVVGSLSACDRAALERTFSADPNAKNWSTPDKPAQLPNDFPPDLQYPQSTLIRVEALKPAAEKGSPQQQTQWTTTDNQNQVLDFYRQVFKTKGWQDLQEATQNSDIVLSAKQQDLQVSISIVNGLTQAQPSPSAANAQTPTTQFVITYQRSASPAATSSSNPSSSPATGELITVAQVPLSLRTYVEDVLRLNVLTPPSSGAAHQSTQDPNQPISRGTYARWLVEANNRLYNDRPSRQIRLATPTSTPAFQDVPANHPDFPAIQGLAEAGYIPSTLSGDASQKNFRPNEPLTREMLLMWKVPVDRQQILPTVSSDKVKQVWGFRDINKISAPALSAIAADRQNGDLGNIRRMFGSTLLFQPQKKVTQAEAIASLWFIGIEGDSLSAKDLSRSEQQINAQQQTESQSTSSPQPTQNPAQTSPKP